MGDKRLQYISEILANNKSKNFVDRIINKSKYPSLDLGKGVEASHLMAWTKVDGRPIVFPTVLYEGGKLKQYQPKEALQRVLKNGEFIEFKSDQQADWFSKNYKLIWGENGESR